MGNDSIPCAPLEAAAGCLLAAPWDDSWYAKKSTPCIDDIFPSGQLTLYVFQLLVVYVLIFERHVRLKL